MLLTNGDGAVERKVQTGAVIVAAGLSSRMNAFKPLLPLGKSTLIETLLGTFHAAGVEGITVVTGYQAALLQARLEAWPVDFRHNPHFATTDMFCSARIGLSHRQPLADQIFFTPGDVPLVAAATLRQLMRAMAGSGASVLIPAHEGRKGHPVLIRAAAIPAILAYSGGQGMKGALASPGNVVQLWPVKDPGILLDADRPEDYQNLCAYARTVQPL